MEHIESIATQAIETSESAESVFGPLTLARADGLLRTDEDVVVDQGVEEGVPWVTLLAPNSDLYECLNGYVFIPEGHPWRWADSDEINGLVDVHGGITGGTRFWMGFDTQHSRDYWPGMERWERWPDPSDPFAIVWSREAVADEARRFARQVAVAGRARALAVGPVGAAWAALAGV